MQPRDIIGAIRKRLWIVIVLTVVTALTGAVAAYYQPPVYKVRIILAAEAPLNPMTKSPDATTTFALSASMQAIASAAQSLDIAKATSKKLKEAGIDIPPEELQDKVVADFKQNTTALTIDFVDNSPTRVAEIANTWGEETTRILSKQPILLGGRLAFTNRASPPSSPTQPKPPAYVGLGAFVGLILGVALAIGLEYFDPHFRSSEETEQMLGLPVIEILPREKRPSDLSNSAYSNIRTSLLLSGREQEFQSVLVAPIMPNTEKAQANIGPGLTLNLAVSIASAGRKTLLVDCDLSGKGVSGLLAADELPGLADFLEERAALEQVITSTNTPNFFVLPAGNAGRMSSDLLSTPLFQHTVTGLEALCDTVLLDGPPLLVGMDSAIVAKCARSSLIVIDVRNCTRSIALKALEYFDRLQIKPTGVILTNVKARRRDRALLERRVSLGKAT